MSTRVSLIGKGLMIEKMFNHKDFSEWKWEWKNSHSKHTVNWGEIHEYYIQDRIFRSISKLILWHKFYIFINWNLALFIFPGSQDFSMSNSERTLEIVWPQSGFLFYWMDLKIILIFSHLREISHPISTCYFPLV